VTSIPLISLPGSKLFHELLTGNADYCRRTIDDDFVQRRAANGIPRSRLKHLILDSMSSVTLSDEQRASLERLGDPTSVAVITGQQVGLFGGPFYTILKIASTVALGRELNAVPMFWLEDNDHDSAEASASYIPTEFNEFEKVMPWDGSNERWSVSRRTFTAEEIVKIHSYIDRLDGRFAESEGARLREIYQEGRSWADAFLDILQPFLAAWGVVVVRGSEITQSGMHTAIVDHVLKHPDELEGLIRQRTQELISAGFHGQVNVPDFLFFEVNEAGRQSRSTTSPDEAALQSDSTRPPQDIVYSPSALSRPLIQDAILPNVATVLGPAEMAYHCQITPAYERIGVEQPMLVNRHQAVLMDPRTERLLTKVGKTAEWFMRHWEEVEREATDVVAGDIEPPIPNVDALLQPWMDAAAAVDPTLEKRVAATSAQITSSLEALNGKLRAAAKKNNDLVMSRYHDLWWSIYPFSALNERIVPLSLWITRLGEETMRIIADSICERPRHELTIIGPPQERGTDNG